MQPVQNHLILSYSTIVLYSSDDNVDGLSPKNLPPHDNMTVVLGKI